MSTPLSETDEATMQRVLEERARAFAQRSGMQEGERPAALHRALIVGVGEEQFGLSLGDVLQIGRGGKVAALPGSPPELAGIANFRGAVYSIMDLAQILTGAPQREKGWLVFLRAPGRRLALLVDRVESIRSYERLHLLEAASPHLAGMLAPSLPLIDLEAFLKHPAFAPGRNTSL